MTRNEIVGLVVIILVAIGAVMFGIPHYTVWERHKAGEAELAQAESNRKILVQTAEAKAQAAEFEKQQKITEASGIAEANKIIGDSLKDNPEYLEYVWLKGLQDHDNNVIYVATEAGIPITESGRLGVFKPREKHTVERELQGKHIHADEQKANVIKE